MREKYNSLKQLMEHYERIKHEVRSCPTVLPKLGQDFQKKNSGISTRMSKEGKLAFIADVERFIKHFFDKQGGYLPVPIDCIEMIFYVAFNCRSLTKCDTYGKLAQRFKIRIRSKEKIPRRLQDKGNLYAIACEMNKEAEDYFRKKGLIVENDSFMPL